MGRVDAQTMMETQVFTQGAVAARRMSKSSIEVYTQVARAAASPLRAPVDATIIMQVVLKAVTMHTMRRKAATPACKVATPGCAAARTALVSVTPLVL